MFGRKMNAGEVCPDSSRFSVFIFLSYIFLSSKRGTLGIANAEQKT